MAEDPRVAALALLQAVTADRRTLAEAGPDLLAPLGPAARARALRLATDTLRQAGRADRLLGPHLRRRPPERVMDLLRLGTVELARGGAAHGVVNACVTLARADKDSRPMAGLVNAVLRRVAEAAPELASLPPAPLPKTLRKPLVAAWGKEAVAAIEAVLTEAPPLDLTPRDGDAAALAGQVGGRALETGSVRLTDAGQVSALPGFDDGAFWVQDAAAALPARMLGVQPWERVLDLCAAPGGKTLQLAAAGGQVTALDISAPRLERLRENLARTGLTAEVVVADALEWTPDAPFDAVLVDAPCSATGTLRRHPDLAHARTTWDLGPLVDLQRRLTLRAAGWLRPGGRLVFATCSLFPEEGESQARALAEAGLIPDPAAREVLPHRWHSGACGLRTRPDLGPEGGIDGFYMAAFRTAA